METPHIKFTWSSDALATILDTLGVQGLGSVDTMTGLYSTWPDREQWALYTSKLQQWMPKLLSDEEREILQQKLSTVESAFNTYLSQPDADNKDRRIAELGELIEQLEELEALICDRGSHAAYPYFARWFTLNLAVVKAFMNYEKRAGQLRGLKLWWSGRYYLERVFHSAYTARASQLNTNVTGAFMDRVYVRDEQTGTPLTIDVRMGGEDEIAILNIQKFLRSEAGWQYIQDISLEESVKILGQVRNSLVVTTDSPTKQDQVLDVSQFWRSKQELIEYEIAEQRKACEPAFDRLINHEAPKPSLQAEKVDSGEGLLTRIDRMKLAKVGAGEGAEEVALKVALEVAIEVVPALIDMIPFVGTFINSIGKLFFKFLGGIISEPNPWVEFEKKMERLVKDKISDLDANNIRNTLTGFDEILQLFFREHFQYSKSGIIGENTEFINRALGLLSQIDQFKPSIFTPASGSYYKIAPYYEHFFLTYMTILAVAERVGVKTVNFVERRTALYEHTNTFIAQAINGIVDERCGDIDVKDESSCSGYKVVLYDYRLNIAVAGQARPNTPEEIALMYAMSEKHHSLNASRYAAGLIAAIQLVRDLSLRVDGIIQNDPESSFNKTKIKETYKHGIWHWHGQVWMHGDNLKQEKVEFLVHNDTMILADLPGEALNDYLKKPPYTIFHIPIPITIDVATDYHIYSKGSRKVLDVSGASTENGANILQWSIGEGDHQKWKLEDAGDGYYYLVSKKSGKVATVDVNGTNKNNVIQYDKITTAEYQKWKLENAGDGYYYLVSKKSGQVLDIENGSGDDGGNIQQHPNRGSDNQKWGFEAV